MKRCPEVCAPKSDWDRFMFDEAISLLRTAEGKYHSSSVHDADDLNLYSWAIAKLENRLAYLIGVLGGMAGEW